MASNNSPETEQQQRTSTLLRVTCAVMVGISLLNYSNLNKVEVSQKMISYDRAKQDVVNAALRGTDCLSCHAAPELMLPRRHSMTKFQFIDYVRGKDRQGSVDMPSYTEAQLTEDDLSRMYLLLYRK